MTLLCSFIFHFDLVVIGRLGFFLSCPLYFFPYSRLSSFLLRLYFILAVPMLYMFGKTLVHGFPISYIAILDATFFFAKRHDVLGRRACQELTLIIIIMLIILIIIIIAVASTLSLPSCHCVTIILSPCMSPSLAPWLRNNTEVPLVALPNKQCMTRTACIQATLQSMWLFIIVH